MINYQIGGVVNMPLHKEQDEPSAKTTAYNNPCDQTPAVTDEIIFGQVRGH